jgi:vancomycin resistance protein VanW
VRSLFRVVGTLFLLGLFVAGLLIGLFNRDMSPGLADFEEYSLEGITNPLELTSVLHPYGRPVYGSLQWEEEEDFKELCLHYKTDVRMAAYQTTLPEPLPGEEYNVALAAKLLAGTVVAPGSLFSMNSAIGPYTRERGFREGAAYHGTQVVTAVGGGVCKIASTLYNVATLANLKVLERRAHGMLVPYVPPGQDATVSYGTRDLKFKNNTEFPIVIWAGTSKNTLYMAIYGGAKPPEITWGHEIINRQNTYTIYRYNFNLPPGEEKVVIPGADGLTVKSWLIIEYPHRKKEIKELGTDYYKPMPRIVERGE